MLFCTVSLMKVKKAVRHGVGSCLTTFFFSPLQLRSRTGAGIVASVPVSDRAQQAARRCLQRRSPSVHRSINSRLHPAINGIVGQRADASLPDHRSFAGEFQSVATEHIITG